MSVRVPLSALTRREPMMIFIDGTNFIYRLQDNKLKVRSIYQLFYEQFVTQDSKEIRRIYFYTTEDHEKIAKQVHGENFFDNVRVVLGDTVIDGRGNSREKGVDALLVADLIYHAATGNYSYGLIVTADTDFRFAIKRVEDFGCRTGLLSICKDVQERLQKSADEYRLLTLDFLLGKPYIERIV